MCVTLRKRIPARTSATITGTLEVRDPASTGDDSLHVLFYQNSLGGQLPTFSSSVPDQFLRTPRQPRREEATRRMTEAKAFWAQGASGGDPLGGAGEDKLSQGDGLDHWNIDDEALPADGDALVIPLLTGDFDSIKPLDLPATLLEDIDRVLVPPAPKVLSGRRTRMPPGAPRVKHQQYGPYHLVLAESAEVIASEVKGLDSKIRPDLDQETCDELARAYGCPFAVLCFNSAAMVRTQPVAFAFKPQYPTRLMVYTLEAHGHVPNYQEIVQRDHTLFVGSWKMDGSAGKEVRYSNPLPTALEPYVLPRVHGVRINKQGFGQGKTLNGDLGFYLPDLHKGNVRGLWVTPPKVKPAADRPKVVVSFNAGSLYNETVLKK